MFHCSLKSLPLFSELFCCSSYAVAFVFRDGDLFDDLCFAFSSNFSIAEVDEKSFIEASESGNLIPLCKCIFSDHLTPVLAYRCLVKEDERDAPSFLFESVEPGFRGSSVVRNKLCCYLSSLKHPCAYIWVINIRFFISTVCFCF